MEDEKKYSFDKLKMFFGEDYKIADGIVIKQPTIGDILEYGEKEFYAMFNPFITNPTTFRVALWQSGIDWNKISDYKLFLQLITSMSLEVPQTSILFGNLDFKKFKCFKRQNEVDGHSVEDIVLINQEQQVLIDEEIYSEMACYLRTMFNIFPKVEKAKDKTTKQWIIEEEIMNSKKEKPTDSTLLPMVSFCLNHPGFKYKKNELKEMGIVEFMDSVQRLMIYESTNALFHGMYSGFCDISKINKQEFNFMREITTS